MSGIITEYDKLIIEFRCKKVTTVLISNVLGLRNNNLLIKMAIRLKYISTDIANYNCMYTSEHQY